MGIMFLMQLYSDNSNIEEPNVLKLFILFRLFILIAIEHFIAQDKHYSWA